MGQEMVKRFLSPSDDTGKKPIRGVVIWLIVGAILFLAFSSFRDDKKETANPEPTKVEEMDVNLYLKDMEERLQQTLEKITGAGTISVFLHFEDGGESVLATNRIQKSAEEKDTDSVSESVEEERDIVRWEQDGVETPYRVKQRFPEPTGILVVAKGATNHKVRQEIYEAVRAVFGLPAHRIKITN